MAIKGKGKTKGRQPARAPRRAPVEVKPPFFMRRRVQVALAFVAGILLMMLAVWITNGLRQQKADDKAAADAVEQRSAGQDWRTQVEGEFGKIGTISPGAPPALFPDLTTTITALQKGKVPEGATSTLTTTQAGAKSAAAHLDAYKLADAVRDTGMDEGQVSWFLNSQARYVQALHLYEQAAVIAALAVDAPDAQRTDIADSAAAIQKEADAALQAGYSDYQNALASVQIFDSPLTSLTGPTGA